MNMAFKGMETGKGKYFYKALPEFLLEEQFEDKKKSEIIDDLDELAEGILDNLEDEYGVQGNGNGKGKVFL